MQAGTTPKKRTSLNGRLAHCNKSLERPGLPNTNCNRAHHDSFPRLLTSRRMKIARLVRSRTERCRRRAAPVAGLQRAARGFNPAFVMTLAASADDRKRSSATACSEPFGSAPTNKVGGWISTGTVPTKSAPGSWISSATCWKPISASYARRVRAVSGRATVARKSLVRAVWVTYAAFEEMRVPQGFLA